MCIRDRANSPYGLDQGRLADGEEVEGYNLDDFMAVSYTHLDVYKRQPTNRDSDHYWGSGKFAFTDLALDENGNKVEGSVGYNTAYDWDCKATSYFLWDDDNIYIAVRVIDTDVGVIDDAHYAMACEDTINCCLLYTSRCV